MKKSLLYVLSALVVFGFLGGMFVFSSDTFKGDNNTSNNSMLTVDMNGDWRLVVHKTPSDMETDIGFLSLNSESGIAHIERNPDGNVTALDHTWSVSDNKLVVDGVGSFIVDVKTENYVHLYEAQDCYFGAIRCFDRDTVSGEPHGTWNVTFHQANQAFLDEYIVFENNTLYDYRDNTATPALVTAYHMTGPDRMYVEELHQDVLIRYASDKLMFLVESESGRTWELQIQE